MVCSFVCDFIALEIMASELVALHDDNFACISDACAVEPRRRFVTERGKKKINKRKPKFKPRLLCLGNNLTLLLLSYVKFLKPVALKMDFRNSL